MDSDWRETSGRALPHGSLQDENRAEHRMQQRRSGKRQLEAVPGLRKMNGRCPHVGITADADSC
jgi:hypothetical protein